MKITGPYAHFQLGGGVAYVEKFTRCHILLLKLISLIVADKDDESSVLERDESSAEDLALDSSTLCSAQDKIYLDKTMTKILFFRLSLYCMVNLSALYPTKCSSRCSNNHATHFLTSITCSTAAHSSTASCLSSTLHSTSTASPCLPLCLACRSSTTCRLCRASIHCFTTTRKV